MTRIGFCTDWLWGREGEALSAVTLPHDAMLQEPRTPDSPGGQSLGYCNGGVYVYQKRFSVDEALLEQRVLLQFEGVYGVTDVYLNGEPIAHHMYGYTPFEADLTGKLRPGETNVLTVRVDNSELPNSRWYTGSGIYRPVWMMVGNGVKPEDVRITTLSVNPAVVRVETPAQDAHITLLYEGCIVAEADAGTAEFTLADADLWSAEHPHRYLCRVTANGDTTEVPFGIRKLEWSPKGFFVNGEETLLRGGCIHHDLGLLGAACCADAEERRVRILKESGFNAIRMAHNPASPALLDACDRLGMYVMDESWDMWYRAKNKHDYAKDFAECWRGDLRAMILRDYNHPSIVMYSVGNEVSEPATAEGVALCRELVDFCHALDSTRPVTCGMNLSIITAATMGINIVNVSEDGAKKQEAPPPMDSTAFNEMAAVIGDRMENNTASDQVDAATSPVLDVLDIAGYNYAAPRYPLEGEKHPNRIVVGSETYPQKLARNWAMVEKHPYVIGDFMWTAWDYLGEAGIGAWTHHPDARTFAKPYPWLLADCGAIDILGHPGAQAAWAKAIWGQADRPWLGVIPFNHPKAEWSRGSWRGTNAIDGWAWQGCEGETATVEVYAKGHAVRLMQNETLIGESLLTDCKASFEATCDPGTLTAILLDEADTEVGRSSLQSGTGDLGIRLTVKDEGELLYVDVDLAYENGVIERNADIPLTVTVEGAELLAFGSANPRTEESYLSGTFTTYYGRAQAILRKGAGPMTLSVNGGGFSAVWTN